MSDLKAERRRKNTGMEEMGVHTYETDLQALGTPQFFKQPVRERIDLPKMQQVEDSLVPGTIQADRSVR